ncbi:MAG: quinoprotein dehydrogenase-associated putative ABC transporter substrate-binding protein, partial [Hyphomicrobium sp.]
MQIHSKSLVFLGAISASVLLLCSAVMAEKVTQTGDKPSSLRVCADPSNLPYSDKEGNGFENKIAASIAKDLKAKLDYHW